ncbi:MAG TPA: LysM peptidoglycan-binding domain-containing protein [Candidatus Competibacter sp.]|nr:LysM peptidoglycan-binding domain-containing protein [Candidatus Competibacteraceae bacterium]HRW66173.1 LysM peptidoglycan-binding domain-containing protein [Candidatus Competibacter sp.]
MNISRSSNVTRSSKRLGTTLSLAAAVLLGACAQTPSQPESGPTAAEPPLISGSAAGTIGAAPAPVVLRQDHPQTYTVVPGDTLWSIAGRFLQNPWQWREIWRQNPQLRNPNRIYPGDVLQFSHDADGQPQLAVAERDEVPLIKLSPTVRIEELSQPIPPVPRDAVESFLTRAVILSDAQWKGTPYIVADDDDQVVYADHDRVYARGSLFDQPRYQVFHPGEALREPGSGRYLGTAGVYLGEAILEQDADPATFTLASTIAPIRAGDRLLPIKAEHELYSFEPHPVPPDTEGSIIAKLDTDVTQITQYSSVIVNLGAQEGIEPGHVLAIYGKGREVEDPVSGGSIKLPGERAGLLMIYKVHDLVSYGLVMQAERAIRLQDRVTTP